MLGFVGILLALFISWKLWDKHPVLSMLFFGWAGVSGLCVVAVLLGMW